MTNPQTLATTKVTITPAEVGAQIVITDRALRTAREDMARAAGRVLGDAVAKKLDADPARAARRLRRLAGRGRRVHHHGASARGGVAAARGRRAGAHALLRRAASLPGPRPGGGHLAHRHLPGAQRYLADGAREPLGRACLRGRPVPGRQPVGGQRRRRQGRGVLPRGAGPGDLQGLGGGASARRPRCAPGSSTSWPTYGYAEYQDAWGVEMYFDAAAPSS